MFAIIVPPVAVIFLVGVFYRSATPSAAFWTLISGFVLGVAMFLGRQNGLLDMHFSVGVGLMFVICTAIFILVSMFGPQDLKNDISKLVYDKSLMAEKPNTSILADYRLHAVLLIMSMLWVLYTFW
jgi:SSS family solute:Na+ symporter